MINSNLTLMTGRFGTSKDKLDGVFYIQQTTMMDAVLRMVMHDLNTTAEVKVQINPHTMEVICQDIGNQSGFSLRAEDHIDNAELMYFILQEDVQCVTYEKDVYIQSTLTSVADNSIEGNGDGYVASSLLLYKVSEERDAKASKDQR